MAKTATLKKTLFKATLLPKDQMARNIALAGLGRADRKVNLQPCPPVLEEQRMQHRNRRQAQRRLHRAVRREHLSRDLEDGVHPPGTHVPGRRQDHLPSAQSNFAQAIADFKAAIAQKVSLIVTYPGLR